MEITPIVSQLSVLHKRIVRSELFEARTLPSGENPTASTLPVCPSNVARSLALSLCQILTVLSSLPLANIPPSGLNAKLLIQPICPVSVLISSSFRQSHKFTTLSPPAQDSIPPLGANATTETGFSCKSLRSRIRLRGPQSFTWLSSLPLASVPSSGSNATLITLLKCRRTRGPCRKGRRLKISLSVRMNTQLPASHSLTVVSTLALTSSRLCECHAREVTGPRCPSNVRSSLPPRAAQTLTCPLVLPLASIRPRGSNASAVTSCRCPSNVRNSLTPGGRSATWSSAIGTPHFMTEAIRHCPVRGIGKPRITFC